MSEHAHVWSLTVSECALTNVRRKSTVLEDVVSPQIRCSSVTAAITPRSIVKLKHLPLQILFYTFSSECKILPLNFQQQLEAEQ